VVEALRQTLDHEYVTPDFRNVRVGIEFPVDRQDYPCVWVDFSVADSLSRIGIAHLEADESTSGATTFRQYTRWRFRGWVSYTVVAMSSFERDRLIDEMVRILAFGGEAGATSQFRSYVESNEFIAMNFDFDEIGLSGLVAVPGTPWGTDEVIYEGTLRMEVLGEFVSDSLSVTLVPLSEIAVFEYSDLEPDPVPGSGWT